MSMSFLVCVLKTWPTDDCKNEVKMKMLIGREGEMGKMPVLVSVLFVSTLISLAACNAPQSDADTSLVETPATREVIATDKAPAAIGPYSQAIRHGNTLYLSGQIGIDPATGQLVEGTEAQTRQVMANLGAVLEAAGFEFGDVVQAQVFLKDLNDYSLVNGIYAEFFTDSPPARMALEVARIPRDARIEVVLTAVR